jgi:hypothetical protein
MYFYSRIWQDSSATLSYGNPHPFRPLHLLKEAPPSIVDSPFQHACREIGALFQKAAMEWNDIIGVYK